MPPATIKKNRPNQRRRASMALGMGERYHRAAQHQAQNRDSA
jgi:hypothetical protein